MLAEPMRRQYSIYIATIAANLLLTACSHSHPAAPAAPPVTVVVPAAPAPIAPPDQSVLTNFPRIVHFRWSAAPQAVTYAIEIDCYHCCVKDRWCSDVGVAFVVPGLKKTEYEFDFWGDQAGRWRVWAVDARSQPGPKSAWSGFSFRHRQ
jgi:hypothetical protein